jgi:hypothetical protein
MSAVPRVRERHTDVKEKPSTIKRELHHSLSMCPVAVATTSTSTTMIPSKVMLLPWLGTATALLFLMVGCTC